MKDRKIAFLCALIVLIASSFGCKNSVDSTPQSGSGTLSGTVTAYGVNAPKTVSPAGITVNLEGTQYTGTTDNSGGFSISNIPAGVYNIIFSEAGFDSMIYPSHHMLGTGADIINDAYLIQGSSDSAVVDQITSVKFYENDSANTPKDSILTSLTIEGHLVGSDAPAGIEIQLFLDTLASSAPFLTYTGTPSANNAFEIALTSQQGLYRTVHSAAVLYIKLILISSTTGVENGSYHQYYSETTTPYGTKTTRTRYVLP